MSRTRQEMTYRKLRAPQHPGQALLDPPADRLNEVLPSNRSGWDQCAGLISGVPLNVVARAAREHLLDVAFDYTAAYRPNRLSRQSLDADTLLILSGHQPRLFHPGVWFKNFVLHALAEVRQAIGIHLIIDNDLAVADAIRAPSGTADQARLTTIAFDQRSTSADATSQSVPFEERNIGDVDFFRAFPDRLHEQTRGLVNRPCVDPLWKHVPAALERTRNLGQVLSQARHQFEAELGLDTLEVPLSHVCDHASFYQLSAHLLQSPARFREIYNAAIVEYRTIHRLRSQSHPAPLLEQAKADWYEVPFWAWSESNPMREPVYARTKDGGIEICCGEPAAGGQRITLPAGVGDADDFTIGESWQVLLSAENLRLRPRALITTMFARVFLSDLFLHGIGGAKYDQVTDVLIEACLGLRAPTYLTTTATLSLPIARQMVDGDDLRQVNGLLRELWFHPETMLSEDEEGKVARFRLELQKKKKKLLAQIPPRGNRKAWNDEMQQINTYLRELARPIRSILQQQRSDLIHRMRNDSILASREYPFCLFPTGFIGRNLLDMAAIVS